MGIINSAPLGMQLAGYFMMPFSQNKAIADDDCTNRRIGARCSYTSTRELYGSHHPEIILIGR